MMAGSVAFIAVKNYSTLNSGVRVHSVDRAHDAERVTVLQLIRKEGVRKVLEAHEPREAMNGV